MARGRDVDDGLRRWATSRAPSVLARAEAEAVSVLRDALVDAATASAGVPQPHRTPQREHESEQGDLLWAYCVLRSTDGVPSELAGVDPGRDVQSIQRGGLTTLVSSVPRADFGAEPLQQNLNDIRWLERVARAHEHVLDAALQMSTIVPLRICTLYEDADGVHRMLEREHDALEQALAALEGCWEWAVKVLVDEERLMSAVQAQGQPLGAGSREHRSSGEGGAYLHRRRLERELRHAASRLGNEVAEHVHARLQDWAVDAVTRPPQNRDLSGHDGAMLLNGAYLVERDRSDELRELVRDLEARHAELGIRIELTGPWPPYNFVAAVGAPAVG